MKQSSKESLHIMRGIQVDKEMHQVVKSFDQEIKGCCKDECPFCFPRCFIVVGFTREGINEEPPLSKTLVPLDDRV